MTWQKTVMSDEEMGAKLAENDFARGAEGYKQVITVIKEAQAELTGDIAFKAGIQEVVEIVEDYYSMFAGQFLEKYGLKYALGSLLKTLSEIAKLKEWGIEA